jgi:uncharacterized membrane protein
MAWLLTGLTLWIVVHLVPSVAPALKARLHAALGAGPYRGVFALLVLLGLVLIVIGWRSAVPALVYAPPAWGRMAAFPLMFVAVLLFGASHAKTNLKRLIRHPQLAGVLLWSVSHLLANGDTRSLLLFGGLGTWALLEMVLISRREGAWVKPERAAPKSELVGVIVSIIVFAVLVALHPYFAGVSLLPLR